MGNSRKEKDKRWIRTKLAIRDAFSQLLVEKDISKITVKEIAEIAFINRNTFYAHYENVYALLDEIEDELLDVIKDLLNTTDFFEAQNNMYIVLKKITSIVNADVDFYSRLINSTSASNLIKKIKDYLKTSLISQIKEKTNLDDNTLDYILEYTLSGILSVYQQWFESDHSQTLDEMLMIIGELAIEGVNKIIDSNPSKSKKNLR